MAVAGLPGRVRRAGLGACAAWVRQGGRRWRVAFADGASLRSGEWAAAYGAGFLVVPRRVDPAE